MTDGELHSYFLHQDRLMWSRLQTLMTLQAITLACSLRLVSFRWAALLTILLGGVLSYFIAWLYLRDYEYRDAFAKKFEEKVESLFLPPAKRFPYKGGATFWWILGVFGVANVLTLGAVWCQILK